jgi:PAS domain S-box-containing protein
MTTPEELLDSLAAIVYVGTPELKLTFANRRAVEFFGLTGEEVAGDRWLELVHPDDRESVLSAWAEAPGLGRYRHEHRIRLADGSYRRFAAKALPLRDEKGAIVRWHGVLTPLPEPPWPVRKRAEAEDVYPLRDAEGNLELIELVTWEQRPNDPAAKLHPRGLWYRLEAL